MLLKLWRQRPERARYAADQARRQYQLAESRAVPSGGGDRIAAAARRQKASTGTPVLRASRAQERDP
jgi:hypothetical protein